MNYGASLEGATRQALKMAIFIMKLSRFGNLYLMCTCEEKRSGEWIIVC